MKKRNRAAGRQDSYSYAENFFTGVFILCAALILLSAFPLKVLASSNPSVTGQTTALALQQAGIDTSADCSVTVSISESDWFVSETPFRLYKVADLAGDSDGNLVFIYTAGFSGRADDIDIQPLLPESSTDSAEGTSRKWVRRAGSGQQMDAAQRLLQVVENSQADTDPITPDQVQSMSSGRSCTFSNLNRDGLGLGLYLVQGDKASAKEGSVTRSVIYQPILISIPQNYDVTAGRRMSGWTYDIECSVKFADPQETKETDTPQTNPTPQTDTPETNPTPQTDTPQTPASQTDTPSTSETETPATQETQTVSETASEIPVVPKTPGKSRTAGTTQTSDSASGPRTGDDSRPEWYITLAGAAGAVIILYCAVKLRRRKKKRNHFEG